MGSRIPAARLKAGMTQTPVGERLGQTQSFVAKIERGDRQLTALELRDICAILGVPVSAVLGGPPGLD